MRGGRGGIVHIVVCVACIHFAGICLFVIISVRCGGKCVWHDTLLNFSTVCNSKYVGISFEICRNRFHGCYYFAIVARFELSSKAHLGEGIGHDTQLATLRLAHQ